MERRTPLTRRTPLDRGTKGLARGKGLGPGNRPLTRRAPLPRPAGPRARADWPDTDPTAPRRPAARRAPRDTGPSKDTRDLVYARDGGRCVRCGCRVAREGANLQHRKGRKAGGRRGAAAALLNLAANLLLVCGTGTTGCHGWMENPPRADRGKPAAHGFTLREHEDPLAVPVLTWHGWHRYDNAGNATPCDPPAEPTEGDA